MKSYTPVLVNSTKPKFSFKTFFLGSSAAKNYYYCGRHKTDDIYIMWIETTRFGSAFCFPCVLDEQGDAMVYLPGRGLENRTKNTAMLGRWNLFVQPATFREEFDVGELTPQDFHEEYSKYKSAALGYTAELVDGPAEEGDAPAVEAPQEAPEADPPAPEADEEAAQ